MNKSSYIKTQPSGAGYPMRKSLHLEPVHAWPLESGDMVAIFSPKDKLISVHRVLELAPTTDHCVDIMCDEGFTIPAFRYTPMWRLKAVENTGHHPDEYHPDQGDWSEYVPETYRS